MGELRELSDEEVSAILDAKLEHVIGSTVAGDTITADREKSLRYYLNLPRGDEESGKSQVQTSDVQDVIEALLPATVKVFVSSDKVVEFQPEGPEDVEMAEQATDYVNHIFMRRNNGFNIIYTWQKDAFLQKNGYVKATWKEEGRTITSEHELDGDGLALLTEEPGIEIVSLTPLMDGLPLQPDTMLAPEARFRVRIRRQERRGKVCVYNIPPENMVVSQIASDIDLAIVVERGGIVGHRERKLVSDLIEDGYDPKLIYSIPAESAFTNTSEQTTRYEAQQGSELGFSDDTNDPALRELWVGEYFLRVDADGDGVAELRKIIRAGDDLQQHGKIIYNEAVDAVDIFSFSPIPMPHQHFGRSIADLTIPTQDQSTILTRRLYDYIYRSTFPRPVIDMSQANEFTIDDLLTDAPGAPIRARGATAVTPLTLANNLPSDIMGMLEYVMRQRELRTPVTRNDQGVDPNVLDKTATEAALQSNASAERKELILRLFADSLGKLFQHILRLTVQYQDKTDVIRLRNDWVEIDPRSWNADMDVQVNVGLGTGTKEQRLASLQAIRQDQLLMRQTAPVLVSDENLFQASARMVENAGLNSPELYYTDPQRPAQQQDPNAEAAQAQMQIADQAYQQGMDDGKLQIEREKLQFQREKHADNTELEAMKLGVNAADKAEKANKLEPKGINGTGSAASGIPAS